MRHLLYLTLSLALGACSGGTGTDPVRHDSTAEQANLAQLRGQWVVINYWAQWCKPCIKEIPELNELDQQYAKITVVGVNYDDASGQDLAQQVAKLG
ncbi:MAG: TlpA disulfide reductase family protein, partial [Halioglobus sp.]